MQESLFGQMKAYIAFGNEDAVNIRALAEDLRQRIPDIVNRFYEVLLQHAEARMVFDGGEAQMARQRELLARWLHELVTGVYDHDYFESRLQIGTTHVRVGLPQRFMVLGMEIVWQELTRVLQECSIPDLASKLQSVHKLLMLDLTVMLNSYQESYSDHVRAVERGAMEAKLLRAEHMAEIGQLAASLAHEIKNPLAGISGAIQIIGDSIAENDPHRAIVHEILGQIARLDATVKDLLLYARPKTPAVREVKLNPLVSRVLTLLREEPAIRRVRVEYAASNEETALFADEGQLEQLLINLILNAAQASVVDSVIQIGAGSNGKSTRLIVRDFGHGMKPEVLAKALEPFFTTKAKGTGLGLAICQRIAEAHGGTMWLESDVGKGTTVFVDLPCGPNKESGKE